VPPDSFCQIFFPTAAFWEAVRLEAGAVFAPTGGFPGAQAVSRAARSMEERSGVMRETLNFKF